MKLDRRKLRAKYAGRCLQCDRVIESGQLCYYVPLAQSIEHIGCGEKVERVRFEAEEARRRTPEPAGVRPA